MQINIYIGPNSLTPEQEKQLGTVAHISIA